MIIRIRLLAYQLFAFAENTNWSLRSAWQLSLQIQEVLVDK